VRGKGRRTGRETDSIGDQTMGEAFRSAVVEPSALSFMSANAMSRVASEAQGMGNRGEGMEARGRTRLAAEPNEPLPTLTDLSLDA